MGFVKWLGFKARFTHQENFSGFSTLRVFRFAAFTHTSQTEDIIVLGLIVFAINSGFTCFYFVFTFLFQIHTYACKRQNLSSIKMLPILHELLKNRV